MFPITKDKLSFIEIADYWARDPGPSTSEMELLALLEQAWWLGEIPGVTAVSRLQLLQGMFQAMRDRHDLEIVFVQGDHTAPTVVTELEDGGALVDLRPRIPVPMGDICGWDEQTCEAAFRALAQTSSTKHYPDFAPALGGIELAHQDFFNLCKMRGYAEPTFWRSSAKSSSQQKSKRGRPPEYNWLGVRKELINYASMNGPVQNLDELLQKCSEFASELHPTKNLPDDHTIRAAIKTYELDSAGGMPPGK
jgi:hypothetical protein